MARTRKRSEVKSAHSAMVTLKRMVEKGEVSPQAFAILGILKSKGGTLGTEELKHAMQSKVDSVQPMSRIWAFYRARLVEKGFIAVQKTKKEKETL